MILLCNRTGRIFFTGREQIVNKMFVKMMDELGYDVELTYKKKETE